MKYAGVTKTIHLELEERDIYEMRVVIKRILENNQETNSKEREHLLELLAGVEETIHYLEGN